MHCILTIEEHQREKKSLYAVNRSMCPSGYGIVLKILRSGIPTASYTQKRLANFPFHAASVHAPSSDGYLVKSTAQSDEFSPQEKYQGS